MSAMLHRNLPAPYPCELLFEGAWKGQKKVKEVIKRGEEILIPYTYNLWTANPDLDPFVLDLRQLPSPKLTPL